MHYYAEAILYLLLVAILVLFRHKTRGKSLSDLFEQDIQTHHLVQKVMAKHPHGGTWRQYRQWLADEEKHRSP